jgi:hypothetical protein
MTVPKGNINASVVSFDIINKFMMGVMYRTGEDASTK